jgi:hypothetical protein
MAATLTITHPSLKDILVTALQTGFAQRDMTLPNGMIGKTPTVDTADPADFATLPSIIVTQLADGETFSHIGDSLADQYLPFEEGDTVPEAGISALFTQVVEVKLVTTNKDQRDRLGKMLKEELFRARGTSANPGILTTTPGLDTPKITGGHDENLSDTSQEFAPHPLFFRTYTLSALTELTIQEPAAGAIGEIDILEIADPFAFEPDGDTASQQGR